MKNSFSANGVYLIVGLIVFTASFARAQDQGEIERVEIEIIKDRQIVLPKADRNFEKVPPRPIEPIKPEIIYTFQGVKFKTPEYNPAIRPMKLKAETIGKIYSGYVSAGYGNYASPYLEGTITNKRDKNKFYGAKLFHHSFGSGPVGGGNSSSGSTELRAFGKTFGRAIAAGGFLSFENRTNKFYGELPGVFRGSGVRQSYSIFGLGAEINNTSTSNLDYSLKAGYSYLSDNFSSSESEWGLNFNSSYQFKKTRFDLHVDYFLLTRKFEPQASKARHLFKIKPAYQFSVLENLRLTIGSNIAFQNDTLGVVKSINLYPHIMANYELSSSMQAYAGLTGDMDKVSLHSLSRENSWIMQNVLLNHTNRTVEFLAGLKGKLATKIAFHAGFATANLKNLYFYRNDFIKDEEFSVVYDQGNTQRINLFAELGYSSVEKVKMAFRGDYFGYSTDKEAEAWHRPTYRVGFIAAYNIYSKILLDVDFIVQGGMKALSIDQPLSGTFKTVTLSSATELNLKASYLVSDRFSVFVKGNNLLDNQYQLYLYYPVRGFQAMAGLTWSF
jgi:hypothetical protein